MIMNFWKRKHNKYLVIILLVLAIVFGLITNFHKHDIFALTKNGKFYTYYYIKLKFPKSATDIQEYSDGPSFLGDGTEVITFKVSNEELEKLLNSMPFGKTDQWHKGPYPGCLTGFLPPCPEFSPNIFSTPSDHVTIQNSNKIYFAAIYPEIDPMIVIVLDFDTLRVLVYKYTT